ncbi:MAG: class II D-tagatose-bisphosphate aldolase, non-catalytic subunit, partial [Candidatus Omnitrophota bacterium]
MIGKFLTLAELFRRFQKINDVTLLGIGPVSKNTIIASLEVARKYDFPLLFIASRNQVDKKELGGGYLSGWDQKGFVSGVKRLAERYAFPKAVYFCRDHGGPWQRDKELNQRIPHDEAIRLGKISFFADIEAGFDLLHIDPTKSPFLKEAADSLKVIVDDTVRLIASVEERRRRLGLPEITYEVGTEDIKGGLTQAEKFRQFLSRLSNILQHQKLPQPNFIVGQTGTLVKLDTNAGFFHPEVARRLAGIARENRAFLKEHNTDYLDEESLRMHPVLGISAANVAPEFGVAETKSLIR